VQPYVALAKALAARGHRVTFATHDDHRAFIESHGFQLRAAPRSVGNGHVLRYQ
jgi:UDP:flavonoid glycosyltransferase YjiC (YdhE family)